MKNAIILHGTCSKNEYYDQTQPTHSNNHWLPWLSKQLMTRGIHTVAVEVPHAYDELVQDFETWSQELERFSVTSETILVGHSFGTGFLLRWLSEHSEICIHQLVLVAPWLDPERVHEDFFKFEIDKKITERIQSVVVFNSLDDEQDVQESTKTILENLSDVRYLEFTDKGHFITRSLGSKEFPELLEEILKDA